MTATARDEELAELGEKRPELAGDAVMREPRVARVPLHQDAEGAPQGEREQQHSPDEQPAVEP